jgi:hypothetical protein
MHTTFQPENLTVTDHLEDLGVDEIIIIILK